MTVLRRSTLFCRTAVFLWLVAASVLALLAGAIARVSTAVAADRYHVTADVDQGGGVLVSNDRGGYYMGRVFKDWSFDRQGAWETGSNSSNYAWGFVYGHTNACLTTGPSAGVSGYTADKWAKNMNDPQPDRCNDTQKSWLRTGNGVNIGSHFNCAPGYAQWGTQKKLTQNATLYWNLYWSGGSMGYDGGTLADPVTTVSAGTDVWYRYTTRDGSKIVVYANGVWGFMPVGVLDRSWTGYWNYPGEPLTAHTCPR